MRQLLPSIIVLIALLVIFFSPGVKDEIDYRKQIKNEEIK